jgi:mono/diheme cytochrome c family protein/glucose/arabinose dehydrogenase
MLLRICTLMILLLVFARCNKQSSTDEPSPPKDPEEELLTFQLPGNLRIELVAAEPMVQDPVFMSFDEDGRLWVVEMRGFMPDIDGNGETDPTGRISILEDTDSDGMMDKSTIYLDSLILPRGLAVIKGGALIIDDYKLWMTQDTNGDLQADTKVLVDSTYAGTRLPEHSGNALWRGLDNWYYNARSVLRYKVDDGKVIRDSTEFRGQWGMSHDDQGRLYYNYNWSQLHADLVPPNYLYRNKNHIPTTGIDHGLTLDRRIYPIRPNPAVNRGYIPGTLDKDGKLLEFTAACSPYVYRSVALPKEYRGNVFVCEPSGNLVKRNVVEQSGFNLKAHDPNPGTEFLASTDERFRPVHITTGPNGTLYVADMYRGLVQHGEYVTPYLREQTLKRKLDAPIHYGRIWRIVPEEFKDEKPAQLSQFSTSSLVRELTDSSGWVRDVAQRLIVERKDTSVVKHLQNIINQRNDPKAKYHALWTLDGLHAIEKNYLASTVSKEKDAAYRTMVMRLLEATARADGDFRNTYEKLLREIAAEYSGVVNLQLALSARVLDPAESFEVLKYTLEKLDTPLALIPDAVMSSVSGRELAFMKALLKDERWTKADGYRSVFLETLSGAIVKSRDSEDIAALFALTESQKSENAWRSTAMLTGIAIQGRGKWSPIALKSQPAVLRSSTIAANQAMLLNNMFEWPGHKVDKEAVAASTKLSEAEQKLFVEGRQQYLSVCSGCHGNNGEGVRRFAPPLAGSEWVLGDQRRLALLVLHGIEGPMEVAGKRYESPDILPTMPSHSTMDDGAITSILVYIRNEWGNDAGGVERRTVGRLRHTTQGRVVPWTVKELNEHMIRIDTVKN